MILYRDFIKFEIIIDGIGTFHGNGRIVLSSRRIVLINTKREKAINGRGAVNDPFIGFEFPLHRIEKTQLRQPVFGSNYLYGFCRPNDEKKYPKDIKIEFKAYFTSGSF